MLLTMSNALTITDEGARFTLFQYEYHAFDDVAQYEYSEKLNGLTIGKAARILLANAVAPLIEISQTAPNTPEAIDAELGVLAIETDLLHSIKNTGRILIDIMANDDDGQPDAKPVDTIEIIGDAWRASHPDGIA